MPHYPTLDSSNSAILGEAPIWVEGTDFDEYKASIEAKAVGKSGKHFLVNKTVFGVVELAIRLGSPDSTLAQVRDELANGIYSERAIQIIDMLVASNFISGGYGEIDGNTQIDAEALVVMALTGNESAQVEVAQRIERLREQEQYQKESSTPERISGEEIFDPSTLVVVHATKYQPSIDKDGNAIIPTTFDATGGKIPRNSIHTTLNHKVQGHMYGSWGNAGYVVISPLTQMMEKNGVPDILNTVDTWWSRNPGEQLNFPNATVVSPGGGKIDGFYEIEGNYVRFKSEGYTFNDLKALEQHISRAERSSYYFGQSIDESLISNFLIYTASELIKSSLDLEMAEEKLREYLWGDDRYSSRPILLERLSSMDANLTLEERLRVVVEQSGVLSAVKKGVSPDREALLNEIVERTRSSIYATLFERINEIAVRETIERLGFEAQSGGMWAWNGDSMEATRKSVNLANALGTRAGAHRNSAEFELTDKLLREISASYTGQYGDPDRKFDWTKYNPDSIKSLIRKIDPKSRRVLYASGLLNARVFYL